MKLNFVILLNVDCVAIIYFMYFCGLINKFMINTDVFKINPFRVAYVISAHVDMQGKRSFAIHLSNGSVFRFRSMDSVLDFIQMNKDDLVPVV